VATTKGRTAPGRPPTRSAARSKGGAAKRASPPGRRPPAHAPAEKTPGLLADHAADLWALGLITLGVLLALALYGAALGPVGRGVDLGLGDIMGWSRNLLPVVCVVAGVMIIAGRRRPDGVRSLIGAGLGLVAVCGLAELAGGSPHLSAPSSDLRSAGGWLGAAVGRPLQSGIGTAGASVLLVAVTVVAVLLATGVTLGAVGRALAAAGRSVTTTGRTWGADRFDRDAVEPAAAVPVPVPVPVPEPEGEPAPAEPPWVDETAEDAVEPASGEVPVVAKAAAAPAPAPERAPGRAMGPAPGDWKLPPLNLLGRSKTQRHDERQLDAAGEALVAALAAHGVETRLVGRTVGPTVTRFELELGPGVKVARVTSLSRDIAYAMASADVRILAPIPGRSAIGVEVPNRTRQLVSLGDVLSSPEAAQARHPLEVALGRDIAGRAVLVNLADMPHVLISGATGAGKSSCINSLITSVLMRSTPDQVRMILIDPKRVELGQYNGLPHLLTPVVVDPKKAANALSWAVKEMERRYDLLAEYGVRDITGFNEAFDRGDLTPPGGPSVATQVAAAAARAHARASGATVDGELDPARGAERGDGQPDPLDDQPLDDQPLEAHLPDVQRLEAQRLEAQRLEAQLVAAPATEGPERLPFVLVVVDELNDLMMVAARDVEESVVRIAQMARAVGIHLVLATQRPSVDVITGVIKANIPSRMAFSVSSLADSRVILDQPGAERLIGKGDMLVLTASSNIPRRLQGPWVSEEEVRQVVAFWRRQGRTAEPAVGIEGVDETAFGGPSADGDDDELLEQAMDLVVRSQLGSTSMLQRKLRVGFARAGRLMDLLERRGVVGPSEGSKARAVLMTPEELESRPR
jgi:S-DNA-T family DNA segregation ATPase FtsK/SpoIIIE